MAEPAYVTIAGIYARRIRGGELAPGTQLPSLAEIAKRHGVSDIVARNAIKLMQSQGLVRSVRRRGIFVADHLTTDTPTERCDSSISLTTYEFQFLDELAGAVNQVPSDVSCGLDEHGGPHVAYVQSVAHDVLATQDWWIRWTDLSRELVVLPICRAQTLDDRFHEVDPCLLFEGHPGRHSFEQDRNSSGRDGGLCIHVAIGELAASEADTWKELAMASGATFDEHAGHWSLRLGSGAIAAGQLNPLFRAARLHGVEVWVEPVRAHGDRQSS